VTAPVLTSLPADAGEGGSGGNAGVTNDDDEVDVVVVVDDVGVIAIDVGGTLCDVGGNGGAASFYSAQMKQAKHLYCTHTGSGTSSAVIELSRAFSASVRCAKRVD
jgi:hypothetical protein